MSSKAGPSPVRSSDAARPRGPPTPDTDNQPGRAGTADPQAVHENTRVLCEATQQAAVTHTARETATQTLPPGPAVKSRTVTISGHLGRGVPVAAPDLRHRTGFLWPGTNVGGEAGSRPGP